MVQVFSLPAPHRLPHKCGWSQCSPIHTSAKHQRRKDRRQRFRRGGGGDQNIRTVQFDIRVINGEKVEKKAQHRQEKLQANVLRSHTFSNSGSHESNVSERTLEKWTPKLLQETSGERDYIKKVKCEKSLHLSKFFLHFCSCLFYHNCLQWQTCSVSLHLKDSNSNF